MSAGLQRVQILGLHGTSKSIDADIIDNTLILVGENGSGKTTFLRILFNLLAGRWRSLSLFRFDSVILTLSGKDIKLNHSDILRPMEKVDDRLLRGLPRSARQAIIEVIESGEAGRNPDALQIMAHRYGLPYGVLMGQLELFEDEDKALSKKVHDALTEITRQLGAQVLYLPTYRRIERELASIVDWLDPDDLRRQRLRPNRQDRDQAYIELVEFGMQDVQDSVRAERESLQKFQSDTLRVLTLTHFGDIVSQAYQEEDVRRLADLSDDAIQAVLSRVDESIVHSDQRNEWFQAIQDARSNPVSTERDKIICHYFLKILDFQKQLQAKEQKIAAFCKVCSEYIVDKEFVYDSASFSFSIRPKFEFQEGGSIRLSDLSSGEKQVVSLFSHLYLSGQLRYFVLIDEPELSLSVPWQRRFLVDIQKGEFCSGLVAVTHSPFIYDNELRRYAHSLGEFTSL